MNAVPASDAALPAGRQAFVYLQASIIGTLANFAARFPLTPLVGFEASVVLSTYIGMGLVFALSFRRAFGVRRPDPAMILRFILVAHVGLITVWLVSTAAYGPARLGLSAWFPVSSAAAVPLILEGGCHGLGIVAGFAVNFLGHRNYSFRRNALQPGEESAGLAAVFAVLIPLCYAVLYAPYGMDSTDFGYFYGHAQRLLHGERPYLDFIYSKPPFSLYWHALWLRITPANLAVLGGKLGFLAEMLGAAWLSALTLHRVFDFRALALPLPLLAVLGFVYGVHTFPPMPWHTADGVLFGAGCLYAAAAGLPWLAGLLGAAVILIKQSFLFVPAAAACLALSLHSGRQALYVLLAAGAGTAAAFGVLRANGAWEPFLAMTTGGLSLTEALEAGILIYLRQNLTIPAAALALWGAAAFFRRKKAPGLVPVYFLVLTVWYVHAVLSSREWIGFGASWPTLLLVLGGAAVLFPRRLINPLLRPLPPAERASGGPAACLRGSVTLGALLLLAWSTGISGGYKIPAFCSTPLLFAALLLHVRLGGKAAAAAWTALICGLIMFRVGYEYPYVFPQRPMPRSSLTLHAGTVFPALSGVLVDRRMYDTLSELKALRAAYGPCYKTLPAFPLAYMLTGDRPALPAEWLQDWEIAGQTEAIYDLLVQRDIVVFFERDQLETVAPDNYARTRYTVPARVRREWEQIDETEHFAVFRRPAAP